MTPNTDDTRFQPLTLEDCERAINAAITDRVPQMPGPKTPVRLPTQSDYVHASLQPFIGRVPLSKDRSSGVGAMVPGKFKRRK